ncbi:hypothetical protein AAE478_002032 [Parahypoxylon ruwenzoriense]
MDPSGPAQPPKGAAYETRGNPTTSNPSELRQCGTAPHRVHGPPVEEKRPPPGPSGSDISGAVPSSLAYGVRGSTVPPVAAEDKRTRDPDDEDDDGGKMRDLGEGAVADAVRGRPGATGAQPDLVGDMGPVKDAADDDDGSWLR